MSLAEHRNEREIDDIVAPDDHAADVVPYPLGHRPHRRNGLRRGSPVRALLPASTGHVNSRPPLTINSPARYHSPGFQMHVKRIHHVTVAVRDLDTARQTLESLFGMSAGSVNLPPGLGVRSLDMSSRTADALQLVASLEPDGPIARFIQRRGEGVYSVALEVDDLDEAVAELRHRAIRVSDPAELSPGTRSAFVASAAAHGVSVQLIESTEPGDEPRAGPPAERSAMSGGDQPAARSAMSGGEAPANPLDLTPDEWSDGD
jgi:methylmalonyl-CoA/ethylmalonyl-CoA epimerase